MSDTYSVTHYSLPWGSLEVITANGIRTLTGICKACGQVTKQEVTPETNPFQAIRPLHKPTCTRIAKLKTTEPAKVELAGRIIGWKVAAAVGAGLLGAGAVIGYVL